jgi:hypothetical protein
MSEEPNEEGAALTGDEAPAMSEVEQIAFEKGWRPKEQFDGPEGNWKPATDFLRRIPNTREMKREIKDLRGQIDRLISTSAKQTARALDEQAREINERFQQAVDNKDSAGAAKAAKEMQDLHSEARAEQGNGGNAEADFARENPWYNTDDEATAYAIGISQRLHAQGKSVEEQLKAAADGVRKRFPELFEQREAPTSRREPAAVATPSRGGGKREKGYADLPADAKRAADNYADLFKLRHGKDLEESRKAYARDYFSNVQDAA